MTAEAHAAPPPNRGGAREAADSKWAASSPRQVGGVLERPGRNRLVGLPSEAGRPLAEDRGTTGQGFQKPDWPSHTRRSHPTQTLCDDRGGVRPGGRGRGGGLRACEGPRRGRSRAAQLSLAGCRFTGVFRGGRVKTGKERWVSAEAIGSK